MRIHTIITGEQGTGKTRLAHVISELNGWQEKTLFTSPSDFHKHDFEKYKVNQYYKLIVIDDCPDSSFVVGALYELKTLTKKCSFIFIVQTYDEVKDLTMRIRIPYSEDIRYFNIVKLK